MKVKDLLNGMEKRAFDVNYLSDICTLYVQGDFVEIENACALIPESETLAVVRNIAARGMADAAHRVLYPAEPGGKDEQKPL